MSKSRSAMVWTVGLAVVLLTSCMTSVAPQKFPAANDPYGEHVRVTLFGTARVTGELLEATDSTWLVMEANQVVLVPNRAIRDVYMYSVGLIGISNGVATSSSKLKRAKAAARFPGGASPQVLAALLEKTGQSAPRNIETETPR